MPPVVVIGAGITGLATAIALQHAGHEVTVVDPQERVGGAVGRWERDGFVLDTGPSQVCMPVAYRQLFADTGAEFDDFVQFEPVDPVRTHVFPDGTRLDLPNADSGKLTAALDAALGDGAGTQWAALLDRGRQIYEAAALLRDGSTAGMASTLARQVGDLPTFAPHLNFRRVGAGYLEDERLRLMLDRYAVDLGLDPASTPAAFVALPYIEHAFGAWQVACGTHRIPLALAQRAHDLGVRLLLDTKVRQIEIETGLARSRVRAVRIDDGPLPAETVVMTGDNEQLRALVDPSELPRFHDVPWRSALRRFEPTRRPAGVFSLYLGVRDLPPLDRLQIRYSEDPTAELAARLGDGRPRPADRPTIEVLAQPSGPRDQAVRVSVTTAAHGRNAHTIDWSATGLARAYADHLLTVLAERGLDLRPHIVVREHRSPQYNRYDVAPGPGLGLWALAGVRRPNLSTPVRGLVLTGTQRVIGSLLGEPLAVGPVLAAVGDA